MMTYQCFKNRTGHQIGKVMGSLLKPHDPTGLNRMTQI